MILGKPIASGNTAKIYLYNNRVVKIFRDHLPETEAIREANKQKFAFSCGLPVPEILEVTKVDGKQAIEMEYVIGKTLGDLYMEDKEKAEDYLKISIEMQQRIHKIIPDQDAIEIMNDKLHRQIEAAPLLDKEQKSYLLNKLASMTFEKKLCHGDFHLFNLIQSDDKVFVIDWVDSSVGDVRADVYRTYLLYSQFSSSLADTYLRLYCEVSGMIRSEVLQWAPIIAAARLSENVSSENESRLLKIINTHPLFE
jgi:tRNA A-37 threonylcarbamoyl transferase component Bud32